MKKGRYTDGRIIGAPRERKAGATTAEAHRRHGIGEQAVYRWKSKVGGVEPSDARRVATDIPAQFRYLNRSCRLAQYRRL